jgi:sortase B
MAALAIAIIGKYSNKEVANNNQQQEQTQTQNPQNNQNNQTASTLQDDIKKLNQTYGEAKGWLKVSNTNINGAVFQSGDNEKYLKTDRDGKKTEWGEYFLDYRSDINNIDNMSHFIIYGHNTQKDSYFSQLLKYKDYNFFKNNKTIEFSTLNGNYKWEIFTVYVTDTNFFYIDTKFANKTEFSDFIKSIKSKSMYDTQVTASENDTILTLSTCDYTVNNGRFVVQAKLVK